MYETLIRGGWVVDGTGGQRCRADMGIRNGRIAAIGALSDLSRMLTQPLARGVATEIDESTWGKIKELFQ